MLFVLKHCTAIQISKSVEPLFHIEKLDIASLVRISFCVTSFAGNRVELLVPVVVLGGFGTDGYPLLVGRVVGDPVMDEKITHLGVMSIPVNEISNDLE